MTEPSPDPRYLAIGALIYAGIAVGWIVVAVLVGDVRHLLLLGLALVLTVLLVGAAISDLRKADPAAEDDETARLRRSFIVIFGALIAAIAVIGGILAAVGLAGWIVLVAAFGVGLHFLPLGRLLNLPSDYALAAGIMLLVLFVGVAVRPDYWVRPVALGMAALMWLAGWVRLWIARQDD